MRILDRKMKDGLFPAFGFFAASLAAALALALVPAGGAQGAALEFGGGEPSVGRVAAEEVRVAQADGLDARLRDLEVAAVEAKTERGALLREVQKLQQDVRQVYDIVHTLLMTLIALALGAAGGLFMLNFRGGGPSGPNPPSAQGKWASATFVVLFGTALVVGLLFFPAGEARAGVGEFGEYRAEQSVDDGGFRLSPEKGLDRRWSGGVMRPAAGAAGRVVNNDVRVAQSGGDVEGRLRALEVDAAEAKAERAALAEQIRLLREENRESREENRRLHAETRAEILSIRAEVRSAYSDLFKIIMSVLGFFIVMFVALLGFLWKDRRASAPAAKARAPKEISGTESPGASAFATTPATTSGTTSAARPSGAGGLKTAVAGFLVVAGLGVAVVPAGESWGQTSCTSGGECQSSEVCVVSSSDGARVNTCQALACGRSGFEGERQSDDSCSCNTGGKYDIGLSGGTTCLEPVVPGVAVSVAVSIAADMVTACKARDGSNATFAQHPDGGFYHYCSGVTVFNLSEPLHSPSGGIPPGIITSCVIGQTSNAPDDLGAPNCVDIVNAEMGPLYNRGTKVFAEASDVNPFLIGECAAGAVYDSSARRCVLDCSSERFDRTLGRDGGAEISGLVLTLGMLGFSESPTFEHDNCACPPDRPIISGSGCVAACPSGEYAFEDFGGGKFDRISCVPVTGMDVSSFVNCSVDGMDGEPSGEGTYAEGNRFLSCSGLGDTYNYATETRYDSGYCWLFADEGVVDSGADTFNPAMTLSYRAPCLEVHRDPANPSALAAIPAGWREAGNVAAWGECAPNKRKAGTAANPSCEFLPSADLDCSVDSRATRLRGSSHVSGLTVAAATDAGGVTPSTTDFVCRCPDGEVVNAEGTACESVSDCEAATGFFAVGEPLTKGFGTKREFCVKPEVTGCGFVIDTNSQLGGDARMLGASFICDVAVFDRATNTEYPACWTWHQDLTFEGILTDQFGSYPRCSDVYGMGGTIPEGPQYSSSNVAGDRTAAEQVPSAYNECPEGTTFMDGTTVDPECRECPTAGEKMTAGGNCYPADVFDAAESCEAAGWRIFTTGIASVGAGVKHHCRIRTRHEMGANVGSAMSTLAVETDSCALAEGDDPEDCKPHFGSPPVFPEVLAEYRGTGGDTRRFVSHCGGGFVPAGVNTDGNNDGAEECNCGGGLLLNSDGTGCVSPAAGFGCPEGMVSDEHPIHPQCISPPETAGDCEADEILTDPPGGGIADRECKSRTCGHMDSVNQERQTDGSCGCTAGHFLAGRLDFSADPDGSRYTCIPPALDGVSGEAAVSVAVAIHSRGGCRNPVLSNNGALCRHTDSPASAEFYVVSRTTGATLYLVNDNSPADGSQCYYGAGSGYVPGDVPKCTSIRDEATGTPLVDLSTGEFAPSPFFVGACPEDEILVTGGADAGTCQPKVCGGLVSEIESLQGERQADGSCVCGAGKFNGGSSETHPACMLPANDAAPSSAAVALAMTMRENCPNSVIVTPAESPSGAFVLRCDLNVTVVLLAEDPNQHRSRCIIGRTSDDTVTFDGSPTCAEVVNSGGRLFDRGTEMFSTMSPFPYGTCPGGQRFYGDIAGTGPNTLGRCSLDCGSALHSNLGRAEGAAISGISLFARDGVGDATLPDYCGCPAERPIVSPTTGECVAAGGCPMGEVELDAQANSHLHPRSCVPDYGISNAVTHCGAGAVGDQGKGLAVLGNYRDGGIFVSCLTPRQFYSYERQALFASQGRCLLYSQNPLAAAQTDPTNANYIVPCSDVFPDGELPDDFGVGTDPIAYGECPPGKRKGGTSSSPSCEFIPASEIDCGTDSALTRLRGRSHVSGLTVAAATDASGVTPSTTDFVCRCPDGEVVNAGGTACESESACEAVSGRFAIGEAATKAFGTRRQFCVSREVSGCNFPIDTNTELEGDARTAAYSTCNVAVFDRATNTEYPGCWTWHQDLTFGGIVTDQFGSYPRCSDVYGTGGTIPLGPQYSSSNVAGDRTAAQQVPSAYNECPEGTSFMDGTTVDPECRECMDAGERKTGAGDCVAAAVRDDADACQSAGWSLREDGADVFCVVKTRDEMDDADAGTGTDNDECKLGTGTTAADCGFHFGSPAKFPQAEPGETSANSERRFVSDCGGSLVPAGVNTDGASDGATRCGCGSELLLNPDGNGCLRTEECVAMNFESDRAAVNPQCVDFVCPNPGEVETAESTPDNRVCECSPNHVELTGGPNAGMCAPRSCVGGGVTDPATGICECPEDTYSASSEGESFCVPPSGGLTASQAATAAAACAAGGYDDKFVSVGGGRVLHICEIASYDLATGISHSECVVGASAGADAGDRPDCAELFPGFADGTVLAILAGFSAERPHFFGECPAGTMVSREYNRCIRDCSAAENNTLGRAGGPEIFGLVVTSPGTDADGDVCGCPVGTFVDDSRGGGTALCELGCPSGYVEVVDDAGVGVCLSPAVSLAEERCGAGAEAGLTSGGSYAAGNLGLRCGTTRRIYNLSEELFYDAQYCLAGGDGATGSATGPAAGRRGFVPPCAALFGAEVPADFRGVGAADNLPWVFGECDGLRQSPSGDADNPGCACPANLTADANGDCGCFADGLILNRDATMCIGAGECGAGERATTTENGERRCVVFDCGEVDPNSALHGGTACVCDPGYENTATGSSLYCEACRANQVSEAGGACGCPDGMQLLDTDGETCVAACPAGTEMADGACAECGAGFYKPEAGAGSCAPCVNGERLDSQTCDCDDGYEKVGGSLECADVNECESGTDSCGANAFCESNVPGSYVCACAAGYAAESGDATTLVCGDVDECADAGLNDCPQDCVNSDGGYACSTDECVAGLDACAVNAVCSDPDPLVSGDYACACPEGYGGAGADGLVLCPPDAPVSRVYTAEDFMERGWEGELSVSFDSSDREARFVNIRMRPVGAAVVSREARAIAADGARGCVYASHADFDYGSSSPRLSPETHPACEDPAIFGGTAEAATAERIPAKPDDYDPSSRPIYVGACPAGTRRDGDGCATTAGAAKRDRFSEKEKFALLMGAMFAAGVAVDYLNENQGWFRIDRTSALRYDNVSGLRSEYSFRAETTGGGFWWEWRRSQTDDWESSGSRVSAGGSFRLRDWDGLSAWGGEVSWLVSGVRPEEEGWGDPRLSAGWVLDRGVGGGQWRWRLRDASVFGDGGWFSGARLDAGVSFPLSAGWFVEEGDAWWSVSGARLDWGDPRLEGGVNLRFGPMPGR